MGATGEKTGGLALPRLVLAVGVIGLAINVVDLFTEGRPEPYQAFPLLLVLWATADLLKASRPAVARAVRAAAGVLLVTVGFAVGVPAVAALVGGRPVDWLDIVLGLLTALYAASAAAALVARRRTSEP
ncbi:hypothetical protein [Streptomyces sp. NPDC000229]|uniref:hypothetical protein n=1 Tax=Streptomyces sp. NPDC000229 TaxID=3154247 RepID=UPI0033174140